MATNRAAAEALCLKYIKKISPRSKNEELYKEFFAAMSNEEFHS